MDPNVIIGNQFLAKVVPLIAAAKTSIRIIIFDWRLYPHLTQEPVGLLNTALTDAIKRGVKVQAIVSNQAVKQQLLKVGIQAITLNSQKLLHAKMMLIDDVVAVVGSHNYTASAFKNNLEISVSFTFENQVNDLQTYFQNLWPL